MHRQLLLRLLELYIERYPEDRVRADHVCQFVRGHADCFERTCREGHITGSAWILSADHSCVLLAHHRKLDRWLQLGGHADGDTDPMRVVLREAQEESGLVGLRQLFEGEWFPFDIDVHIIPAHGEEPAHLHHDIRYLLVAPPDQPLRISAESKALRWVDRHHLDELTSEASMLRMEWKTRTMLDHR